MQPGLRNHNLSPDYIHKCRRKKDLSHPFEIERFDRTEDENMKPLTGPEEEADNRIDE